MFSGTIGGGDSFGIEITAKITSVGNNIMRTAPYSTMYTNSFY